MDGNQSVMSGVTDVSGWGGPMGGAVGDGIPEQQPMQQQPQQPPRPPGNVYTGGLNQLAPHQQQPMGSVTRFAPPSPQPMYSPSTSHIAAHQQQPQSAYAARSQKMYGTPQQQQQMSNTNSFVARSQQAYGSVPTMPGFTVNASVPSQLPQFQQQQLPQATAQMMQHQYTPQIVMPEQQSSSTPPNVYGAAGAINNNDTYSVGSFTARSHQAYTSLPHQPPQSTAATARLANHTLYGQQQQPMFNSPPQAAPPVVGLESTQQQQRLLNDAIRKVQEHAYYMKQAIEQQNLSLALDRAAHMVGELGGPPHGQQTVSSNTGNAAKLTPKSYYELYMRALEEMPTFQDYLIALVAHPPTAPPIGMFSSNGIQNVGVMQYASMQSFGMQTNPLMQAPGSGIQNIGTQSPGMGMLGLQQQVPGSETMNRFIDTGVPVLQSRSMRQLYDTVQFYPRVVSRLYLQIAAGSALIQSGECGANWVMTELQQAVKCEQNPVRGLFVRNFLLTALRDKLPDTPPPEVQDVDEADEAESKDDDSAGDERGHAVTRTIKCVDEQDKGTVRDSIEFILSNFMEMNKLWVRIQHLPGEGRNKDVRKRRERERNDLRLLIGNNLMRLSQLECVTSKMYGEIILPKILDHVVVAGDPLSQAYTLDCLVQVFPDEYHIETLPILLSVCPRLRDKVNIRTILQGLMDRLANYLLEEELLDESDTNQVKKEIARDAFGLFEDCVQKVFNARGPKLSSKEVIRLQTALLQFSIKCYPGNMDQVSNCINNCVSALLQANASYEVTSEGTVATNVPTTIRPLDEVSTAELGELLSIPLDSLALRVLELEQYGVLIGFLPWSNQRNVAISMLKAVEKNDSPPQSVEEIDQLFRVVGCLVSDEQNGAYVSYVQNAGHGQIVDLEMVLEENKLISKLIHQLHHDSTDILYEMLQVAKNRILNERSGPHRWSKTLVAIVYSGLRLGQFVACHVKSPPNTEVAEERSKLDDTALDENRDENLDDAASKQAPEECGDGTSQPISHDITIKKEPSSATDVSRTTMITSRTIFAFVQETILKIGEVNKEMMVKLFLDASIAVDSAYPDNDDCRLVVIEFLNQSCESFENNSFDLDAQVGCIYAMAGAIQKLASVDGAVYESVTTKVAQFAARVMEKPQQCRLIAVCAHLFYPVDAGLVEKYSNAQRSLECLQRCLKLADACTSLNSNHVTLFVDLLEDYIFFFEAKNPLVTDVYITGLLALIREHLNSPGAIGNPSREAKAHFVALLDYIKNRKNDALTSDLFAAVVIGE